MTASKSLSPKAKQNEENSRRMLRRLGYVVLAAIGLHVFFDIPMRFFYEDRGWDIPSDPQEKAAYDYAHNLKLPDSVPKPVPFYFAWARLRALVPGQPDVSTQYFEHLCNTEAGDYTFRTVENVEGFLLMRPRKEIYATEIDYDRYALEEPTGVGAGDTNSRGWRGASELVQPSLGTGGEYVFLEQPHPTDAGTVIRYYRGQNDNPPPGYKNGLPAGYRYGNPGTIPFVVAKEESSTRKARYGYTWRGIKRPSDRRYSIGAGEYLVVDLETGEVLGIKRAFKISGRDQNRASRIWWGNARWCKGKEWEYRDLVRDVLQPIPGLNQKFVDEHWMPEKEFFALKEKRQLDSSKQLNK